MEKMHFESGVKKTRVTDGESGDNERNVQHNQVWKKDRKVELGLMVVLVR